VTSANEIRRMFTALCAPPRDEQHARHWSRRRHRHQERARHCHYQRNRSKITKCGWSTSQPTSFRSEGAAMAHAGAWSSLGSSACLSS
jgi:hypothetical protein